MGTILGQNDVPRWSHFIIAFLLAFACVAARFLLDKFIFRRLAVWLVRNGPTTNRRVNETTRAKVAKCSESMWKLTYYATVEFWVLSTIYYQPWFVDNKQYIRGWPDHELQPSIALVYMFQCGFYIYSIAALLVWETRRKDFAVMMSHHIITVMLISGSYMTRFFRVGSVVLALHDASDVFMEAAKVFKYSEKELGASLFFGLFAVSWLVLRLVIFPFWVIWSSCYYMIEVLRLSELLSHVLLYYAFNTMLLTLLVFHLYWWILICSMIRRQLKNRGQVGEDIRSDSEGED